MSETPCKYFLYSKSSFNSIYTLNLLFLHVPECKLRITKFLNALFILDTASLEPSEVEVRSISLKISKTQFFHCFLFLPGILHLFHSFYKNFFTKTILTFLEPSEVEVRSISLKISKKQFFHCFLFLPGILHLFHSFLKTFLQKLSSPFFNNLEN